MIKIMDVRFTALHFLVLLIATHRVASRIDCSSQNCHSKTCVQNATGAYCNWCTSDDKVGVSCNIDNPCKSGDCHARYCYVSISEGGLTSPKCLTDPCLSRPCQNGGLCAWNGERGFTCHCQPQWKGPTCQEDADECESSPCQNSGTCRNQQGGFICLCMAGFSGSFCEINDDDCEENPCLNNGTCIDLVASFKCDCPPNKAGLKCQLDDPCVSNPCRGGSMCSVTSSGNYSCDCSIGWTGVNCDEDIDECSQAIKGICEQGGTCVNTNGSYKCNCPPGLTGPRCEMTLNKCHHGLCKNGGTCISKQDKYECFCLPGFTGETCDESEACRGVDCSGAGCIFEEGQYKCSCPANRTGQYCEFDLYGQCLRESCLPLDDCQKRHCLNGGRCKLEGHLGKCSCLNGYSGVSCEVVDPCMSSPCGKGGFCHPSHSNGYQCQCKTGYSGNSCEKFSVCGAATPCSNGGSCIDIPGSFLCKCPLHWEGQNCTDPVCDSCKCCRISGVCGDICNLEECSFVDKDCKNLGKPSNPYKSCPKPEFCSAAFKNEKCDIDCNTEECLYDGFDCKTQSLNCPNETYCRPRFEDGHCDKQCYNVMCLWDGTDCEQGNEMVQGVIVIKLYVSRANFVKNLEEFLYDLSHQLTCMVKLSNQDGSHAVSDIDIPGFGKGVEVRLKLVHISSMDSCFRYVDSAGDFIKKVSENKTITDFPVYDISTASDPSISTGTPNTVFIVIGAMFCLLTVVLLVGLWMKKRRKVDKTWFPPGFSHNKTCIRSSTDQMSSGSEKQIIEGSDSFSEESFCAGSLSRASKMDFPGDMSGSIASNQAKIPHIPPSLCVASSSVHYNHQMNYFTNNLRPQVNIQKQDDISSKIYNEAIRKYDQTGETPLHLAARYSRADAAQKFLRDGADPNAQDHDGKTPLHAAIAADAVGVFQILLRCGACSVNVQAKDGTTPLICAVRLAIDGMVGDLIKAEADLNKTDDQGKTGLHWAAAVNNLDAAILLLHHGGLNRDAQDDKGQTPLFLAAKEGSFNVAQLLLHNSASMDLADQLDRLPRDIAIEKRHFDIVKLLDEYLAKASQNRGQSNFSDHLLISDGSKGMKQKNKSLSHSDMDSSCRSKKKRKIDMTDVISENNQGEMFALNFQQAPHHLEGASYGYMSGPSNISNNRMYNILHCYRQNQNDFMLKDHIMKPQKGLRGRSEFKWFVGSTGSSPNDSDFAVIQSPNEGSSSSPGYCNNVGVFLSPPDTDHYQQHMLTVGDGAPRCMPASVVQRYQSNPIHNSQLTQTSYGQCDETYHDRVAFSRPASTSAQLHSKQNPPLVFQQYPTPPSQQFSPNGISSSAQASCLNLTQRENLFETPSPGAGDEWVDISMTACMEPHSRQQLDNVMPNESSVC